MKTLPAIFFLIAGVLFTMPPVVSGQEKETNDISGNWTGELDLPGSKLDIIFKIVFSEEGELTATMDVPKQGAAGIPVSEVVVDKDSMHLKITSINGEYNGKFTDGETLDGKWSQNGMSFPLVLSKSEKVPELKRPQMPHEPFPYIVEEVSFKNPKDGIMLAGMLTYPDKEKDYPAVLLITGSGAQDRDETIFGHKPFLVLADYLTRNGFAVLRTDDRGVGGSEGNLSEVTSEDLAGDALAGVNFLKNHDNVDVSHIGLIGHSEGGIIAPIAAVASDDVAFIVMMAGSGINGEQILYKQGELINKAAGLSDEMIQSNRQLQSDIFKVIFDETNPDSALIKLRNAYSRGMYNVLNDQQKKIVDQRIAGVNNPWFKFFLQYDPYPTLTKLKCPVLALNGEKDLQVPPKENLEAIKKALEEGSNKQFKVEEFKGLNHLFQPCETGAVSEYGEIEITLDPKVLETITAWLKEVVN